jgi:hypothetical protein
MGRNRRVLGFESTEKRAKGGKHRENRVGSTGYMQREQHRVQRGEHQEHRKGTTVYREGSSSEKIPESYAPKPSINPPRP